MTDCQKMGDTLIGQPFQVGDICVDMDKHGRQLYDRIHVATTNPVWLYSMKAVDDKITRIMINQVRSPTYFFLPAFLHDSVLEQSKINPHLSKDPSDLKHTSCWKQMRTMSLLSNI